MTEEQFDRLIRMQTQTLSQQGQILGTLHCIKETITESQMRIQVLEAYIERKEKGKA